MASPATRTHLGGKILGLREVRGKRRRVGGRPGKPPHPILVLDSSE